MFRKVTTLDSSVDGMKKKKKKKQKRDVEG